MKIIELHQSVTASNDRDAQVLRAELKEKGLLLINLMSAPGSGKTTLLSRTITDLKGRLKIAVLEADIDSAVDAETIEKLGAVSVQVHTDGMCHMDAGMTREGLEGMDLPETDLAFLENIGNLICPAEYDTGAARNVMILSVPEGDDKPLKYPLMFEKSDALVISKWTDGLIVVVRQNYSDRYALNDCMYQIEKLNAKMLGFVMTDASVGEGSYKHYGKYGKRYGYGYSGSDYGYSYAKKGGPGTSEKKTQAFLDVTLDETRDLFGTTANSSAAAAPAESAASEAGTEEA